MLAPDPRDAIQQLTDLFNSSTRVSQFVGTIENAALPKLTPEPDWYGPVLAGLEKVQNSVASWRTDVAPTLVSQLCVGFINYASELANVVTDLTPVVEACQAQGGVPTAAQQTTMTALVSTLQQSAGKNKQAVQDVLGTLTTFKATLEADAASLGALLDAALPEEAAARALVQQVQTQVQSAALTLAADSASATSSSLSSVNGMISVVVGFGFSAGFAPASFGISLLFLGVDAILQAGTEARVISDLNQLEKLRDQLAEDELQLGTMQGIVGNLEVLNKGIVSALSGFDRFDDTWDFALLGLDGLMVVLNQPTIDVATIPDLGNLSQAQAAWQQISDFAAAVLKCDVVPQAPITLHSNKSATSMV